MLNMNVIEKIVSLAIMKKAGTLFTILLILVGIGLSDCKYRKDCGGRRKKKVKTGMGGYM